MASIDLYTKQQIDAKLPDTSGASSGDVLTFNGTNTEWAAPSGGGSRTITNLTTVADVFNAINNIAVGDEIIIDGLYDDDNEEDLQKGRFMKMNSTTLIGRGYSSYASLMKFFEYITINSATSITAYYWSGTAWSGTTFNTGGSIRNTPAANIFKIEY